MVTKEKETAVVEEAKVEEAVVEETSKEELEEIFIPRGNNNDEPDLMVGINGVNYLLPKGKTHKVPAVVAAEIKRSWQAQATASEHSSDMLSAAPKE